MKGLILCAGKGTRLRPFTYSGAKHLLPVANKPVVFYIIEALKNARVDEIAIVVGDAEDEFKDKLGDGSRWGISLTYIKQENPLGLAHGVKIAEEYTAGQPFITVLGDNLVMHPLKDIINYFAATEADCTLLLSPVEDPKRYGIADVYGNRVIKIIEKPRTYAGNLGIVGVYVFNSEIFDAINRIKPSGRGELEISDAIMEMIGQGSRVNYVKNQRWWKDIGKPEDLLEANMKVMVYLEREIKGYYDEKSTIIGEAVIGEGTTIIRSTVRGPAVIGSNVLVQDSHIGPYSAVGDGSKLIGCEVENSVILDDCLLENIYSRIDMSIIGNGSIIKRRSIPESVCIWAGKDSKIEIY